MGDVRQGFAERRSRISGGLWLWAVLFVVSFLFVSIRGLLILRDHTPVFDHAWFYERGMAFWLRNVGSLYVDNPAAGAGILVFPAFLAKVLGFELEIENQYRLISVWKALIFAMTVAVVGAWFARTWGKRVGLAAVVVLLVDPNLAAHVPIMTVDSLVLCFSVISIYCTVRLMEKLQWRWWFLTIFSLCLAMQSKLVALPIPLVVAALMLGMLYLRKPRDPRWPESAGRRIGMMLLFAPMIGFLIIWATCLGDISPVLFEQDDLPARLRNSAWIAPLFADAWPAGNFLRSILCAIHRSQHGLGTYLLGELHFRGVWYYFPVVVWYKVPWGILACVATGALVLFRRGFVRWSTEAVVIAAFMVFWTVWLSVSPHQLGIHHYIVPLFLMLLVSSFALTTNSRLINLIMALCLVWAGVATMLRHPNYLSFTNLPERQRPWVKVNESNIEWDHIYRQIERFLDQHPDLPRPIYLRPMRVKPGFSWVDRVFARVTVLGDRNEVPPTRFGTLITTTTGLTEQKPGTDLSLFTTEPIDAVIGDCVLVFDLDKVNTRNPQYFDQSGPPPTPIPSR